MQKQTRPHLLIVDDDPLIRNTLAFSLSEDFDISLAADRSEALATAQSHGGFELTLLDLGLPPHPHRADEGLALISELLALKPSSKIIVLSGQNEEIHARHARTLGALEFIPKPASPALLHEALKKAQVLQQQEEAERNSSLTTQRILGKHPLIENIRREISNCADKPFPLLIEGESGTGKEIAARSLHELSARKHKPFIALNCAAISSGLIEATLFGHARGAFTGAATAQAGYFEEADQGTLFLDEIGELPLELQPKLLRVLESGEFQRVGETQTRYTRTRILAATNRDLRSEVRSARFRPDLYHRISVLRIAMPALRQMGTDRLELLEHFQQEISRQLHTKPFVLHSQARKLCLEYDFPGNVRELRNIVARLLSRHSGQEISATEFEAELEIDTSFPEQTSPPDTLNAEQSILSRLQAAGTVALDDILRQTERDHIAAALRLAHGNMSQAARMLGMNRSTLYSRIETLAKNGRTITPDFSLSRE